MSDTTWEPQQHLSHEVSCSRIYRMAGLNGVERLRIIRKINKLLETNQPADIGLVYDTFGIQYSWSDDRGEQLNPNLVGATNKQLEELLSVLESDHTESVSPQKSPKGKPSAIWAPNRVRVFLSHVSKDKVLVTSIKSCLADFGISAFVAHKDIEPTKEWIDVILEALESCHALAALLTPNFHESKWTDQEIGYCLHRRIPMLSVRLGMDPYGFLGRFQGLPGSEKPQVVADQIFGVLIKKPEVVSDLAAALVDQFVKCKYYQISHHYLKLLNRLPDVLTAEQLDQIEKAVKTNAVLKEAHFMPEKVKEFLGKRRPVV